MCSSSLEFSARTNEHPRFPEYSAAGPLIQPPPPCPAHVHVYRILGIVCVSPPSSLSLQIPRLRISHISHLALLLPPSGLLQFPCSRHVAAPAGSARRRGAQRRSQKRCTIVRLPVQLSSSATPAQAPTREDAQLGRTPMGKPELTCAHTGLECCTPWPKSMQAVRHDTRSSCGRDDLPVHDLRIPGSTFSTFGLRARVAWWHTPVPCSICMMSMYAVCIHSSCCVHPLSGHSSKRADSKAYVDPLYAHHICGSQSESPASSHISAPSRTNY